MCPPRLLNNNNVSTKITEQDNKDLLKDENLKPKQVCLTVNFEHVLQSGA